MNYLLQSGIELSIDTDKLTAQQKLLIENEGINNAEFDEQDADDFIKKENGLLFESDGHVIEKAENWTDLARAILFPGRKAEINRSTKETEISVSINLDGTGKSTVSTGLKFFDHMLDQIARHGLIDLELTCKGDLDVDEHHTIEDTAIALGQAIREATFRPKCWNIFITH